MKLKLDENGHVVVTDGKPVYVADDGKEVAFDYSGTLATISRLNAEAKSHREAKEAAEGKLKAFEGIDDPAAALKALTTVKNFDDKKLVDAGQIETVKAEAIKAVRAEYEPVVKERDALKSELVNEKIGGSFARSKFIGEKLILPGPAAQKIFGDQFKIEDGKLVGYDASGNKLYSAAKPGEIADFEEALEILVSQYPYRDNILKGVGSRGDGANGSNGGNNGAKSMNRAAFEQLSAADKVAKMKDGYTIAD